MKELHDIKYFSLNKVKKFIAEYGDKPGTIKELCKLILSEDHQISMRASWTLQHLSFEKPEVIKPLYPQLISFLKRKNNHTGAIRNVIRIFQEQDIPEKYTSEIYDLCLAYCKNVAMPHAVRVFAIYVMANICKKYPELKYELELILSEFKQYPQPPSMTACIKKTTKQLKNLR